MNRARTLVALAALAVSATVVLAQTYGNWGQKNQPTQTAAVPTVPAIRVNVSGGVNPADSSFAPLQFNSSGYVLMHEGTDLGTQTSGWITLANGTASGDSTAVGTADSSAVVSSFSGYVLHGLAIRASLPSGGASATNAFCRVAIQIRTHVGGLADSINTTPVLMVRSSGVTNDSTAFGRITQANTVQEGDDEFVVVLVRQSMNAGPFAANFARYIPLEFGGQGGIRLQNFSVRWRVLSATANTNGFWISAYATVLR